MSSRRTTDILAVEHTESRILYRAGMALTFLRNESASHFLICCRETIPGALVLSRLQARTGELNLIVFTGVGNRTLPADGQSVEHPIAGDELQAIKRYLKGRESRLPWLLLSERAQPMTRQSVNYMITTAGDRARPPRLHRHMLRNSCGFYLADRGYDLRLIQGYLGPRDQKHTVHYTRVAGRRFNGLWPGSRAQKWTLVTASLPLGQIVRFTFANQNPTRMRSPGWLLAGDEFRIEDA